MKIEIKKLNDTEYIIYLIDESGQKIKAKIIKADLQDKIWD
jgi:hypothetical protein|tara:strand:+ start:1980 stop:2102 length:123 start_codon:yes stop_codon:yes gene_type:complete